MKLSYIERETGTQPDASVIWLHGLGANGHDFEPIVPELGLPDSSSIRFIFPHAASIPVTINGGMVMPAWYDILEMSINRQVDYKQLMASASAVKNLIDMEVERGIKSNRIIVAGFSQGGAVAIQTALTYPSPLAGLLAMSTYFATEAIIEPHEANQQIDIQVQHGTHDPVVPIQLGEACRQRLTEQGYSVSFNQFAMEHAVCVEQIQLIGRWIRERLSS